MATLKKFLAYMLGGAILGAVVATLIGLWLIPWYNAPGSGAQSVVDPTVFARAVIHSVVQGQLLGAGIGAVVSLVIGIAFHRAGSRKASERASLSASAASAANAVAAPKQSEKSAVPPM